MRSIVVGRLAMPEGDSLWEDLVSLVRSYARRKYGWEPIGLTLHGPFGDTHREPLPRPLPEAARREPGEGVAMPKHTKDYSWVVWPGVGEMTFSCKQARVIQSLFEAAESDVPHVSQADLLRRAESDCGKLRELFARGGKTHPAWGALILQGPVPGTYTLPPWPGGQEDDE